MTLILDKGSAGTVPVNLGSDNAPAATGSEHSYQGSQTSANSGSSNATAAVGSEHSYQGAAATTADRIRNSKTPNEIILDAPTPNSVRLSAAFNAGNRSDIKYPLVDNPPPSGVAINSTSTGSTGGASPGMHYALDPRMTGLLPATTQNSPPPLLTGGEADISPITSGVGGLSAAAKNYGSPPPGVPTVGDLHSAIRGFSYDPDIAFSYVPDGCYARAEIMSNALNQQGIPTNKIWAYATDMNKPLEVPGAKWGWHVAPRVRAWNPNTGLTGSYVVDPSMSGKPMKPGDWVAKMNPNGGQVRLEVTSGDAYLPNISRDGGFSGEYLRTNDPAVSYYRLGPAQTMEEYGGMMLERGLPPNSGPPDGIPTDAEVAASQTGKVARLGSAVSRGLGGVAMVGGGFQVAAGIQEWQQGHKADGGVDVVSGALNVAGGAAMATGVGTVAAPFLFGGSAVIDGGRDIVHGVQNGDGEKVAVGAAKAAGGGMMIAGGAMMATGVLAPVGAALIVGGAVVAGGAALYDARDTVASGIKSAWNTVTGWF